MRTLTLIFLLFLSLNSIAQDTIIVDQIIARVGDEIILQSDVEASYFQWLAEGNSASPQAKCNILEDQLIQKLLINQAHIDSIDVSEDELEMQVDSRVNMFIQQLGGVTELETYLNKNIYDIKEDLKKVLKNQLIASKMQATITDDVSITPSEVAEYYNSLSIDSLPLVDITYEIRQIAVYPKLTDEEAQITLEKLEDIRGKIVSGERRFESMATMYSEDPGSAGNGGELGFFARAELDPIFAAAAFSLKEGEVSKVIKSQFGYHIIQMIERRGERVNVRHILIKAYIPAEAKQRTIVLTDSLRQLLVQDSISFDIVASSFSEDEDTKNNGGLVFNQMTGSTKFKISELPHYMKLDVISMPQGEVSKSVTTTDAVGNTVIKLYYLESKTPEHVANMEDDYQLILDMAMMHYKQKVFSEWIIEEQKNVYISILKQYQSCTFKYKKWLK
jgi:peptidyl-prolyl cis-trans isomerase SurA